MPQPPPPFSLDTAFSALADPTRRAILARLARGEATVQDIAAPFPISQPAVSRHLKVLEAAGLIETRIDRTARPRRLRAEGVAALWGWMDAYRRLWDRAYARLDTVLEEMQSETTAGNKEPDP